MSLELREIPHHQKKEIEAALVAMRKGGWKSPVNSKGHNFRVHCPYGCCQHSIAGTPKRPFDTAQQIGRMLRNCPGG